MEALNNIRLKYEFGEMQKIGKKWDKGIVKLVSKGEHFSKVLFWKSLVRYLIGILAKILNFYEALTKTLKRFTS